MTIVWRRVRERVRQRARARASHFMRFMYSVRVSIGVLAIGRSAVGPPRTLMFHNHGDRSMAQNL